MTHPETLLLEQRHLDAMSLCDRAVQARARHDLESAAILFKGAFELERVAAAAVAGDLALEPTRSVLHRSAAALALECGEFHEAETLVGAALSGNPPPEIAAELRDLLAQAQRGKRP
jgi:hypothetical protein